MLRFDGVPSLVMSGISRASVATSQRRLAEAQKELDSGRHHDMGLALGSGMGADIGLRLQLAEITQARDLAAQGKARAGMTQSALQAVSKLAGDFLSTLSGARGAAQGQQLASDAARSALAAMTDLLNTTFAGQYLFGGLNADAPPLREFAGGQAEAAIAVAFQTEFGIDQQDPAVSQISAAAMSAFLDGSFAGLFAASAWTGAWSNASNGNLLLRTGSGLNLDASSSANAPFAPKLAQAFSMMMALGQSGLSRGAFEATADKAVALLSEAQWDLGQEQSLIGIAQQRLTAFADASEKRKFAVTQAIRAIESVDPYEAATRVNSLMTQLETSYAITARISRMSLLSYL